MTGSRMLRIIKVLGAGAFLLQAGGCDWLAMNEFIQTVLLGITAAGGVAIIQNI